MNTKKKKNDAVNNVISLERDSTLDVNEEFKDLFQFDTTADNNLHEARMIMFRFLSEIERSSNQQRGLKKMLADSIGKSQSFITQLFNGTKLINLTTLAKFQNALGIKFKIMAFPESEFDKISVSEIKTCIQHVNKHDERNQNHIYIDGPVSENNRKRINDMLFAIRLKKPNEVTLENNSNFGRSNLTTGLILPFIYPTYQH